jgi:excisionase family DNA binding protein
MPARPEGTSRKTSGPLPIEQRAGVTVQLAAQYVGISKSRLYELLKDGTLEGRIVHGRRIVLVPSLLKMIGGAPSAKDPTPPQQAA